MSWKKHESLNKLKTELRNTIKDKLEKMTVSNSELARKAGIDPKRIGQTLSGNEDASVDKLVALLEILGCRVSLSSFVGEVSNQKDAFVIFKDFNFYQCSHSFYNILTNENGKSAPVGLTTVSDESYSNLINTMGLEGFIEGHVIPTIGPKNYKTTKKYKKIRVFDNVSGESIYESKI